jgi:hypothetical protein
VLSDLRLGELQAMANRTWDFPVEVMAALEIGPDIWVGTRDHGLFRYDRRSVRWVSYWDTDIGERITRIWADGRRVWVDHGTWGDHTYCYLDYTNDRGATWTRFMVGDASGDYVHVPNLTNAGLRSDRLKDMAIGLKAGSCPADLVDLARISDDIFFTLYVNSAEGWCRMYRYNVSADVLTDLAIAEQEGRGVGVRQFYADPYDERYVWILSGDYGGSVQTPCGWFRYDRLSGELQNTGITYDGSSAYLNDAEPDSPYLDLVDFMPWSVQFLGLLPDGTLGPIVHFSRRTGGYTRAQ